jgi:glycosyltransferase involved in cell wall biosynthesis
VKLCVIGYETIGHRGYVQQLQETASQLGLGNRVKFLGAMPTRQELLEWCRRCDVGLVFMPKNSNNINHETMTGASNKPFDYLACGLALLVSDLPDWRAMYVEPGYGLACDPDDPGSIAMALYWLLDHPHEMRRMGEEGRQKVVAEWNYETQFMPVWQRMKERE